MFSQNGNKNSKNKETKSEPNPPQMVWGKTDGLDTVELTYSSCRGTEMSVNLFSRNLKVSGQPDSIRRRLGAAFDEQEVNQLVERAIENFLNQTY